MYGKSGVSLHLQKLARSTRTINATTNNEKKHPAPGDAPNKGSAYRRWVFYPSGSAGGGFLQFPGFAALATLINTFRQPKPVEEGSLKDLSLFIVLPSAIFASTVSFIRNYYNSWIPTFG